MKISEINMTFRDEDEKYEIIYYIYLYQDSEDLRDYRIVIKRYNTDSRQYHIYNFQSKIGNPEYLFKVFNDFRKKPEIYFWKLNKLFGKEDIVFSNPDITELPITDKEGVTTNIIKFY